MRPIIALCAVALLASATGCALFRKEMTLEAGQSEQSLEATVTKKIALDYLLFIPESYAYSQKQWPLMLFLHGAGERGSDLNMVRRHGPPKLVEMPENSDFPFIVISPQCPPNRWWDAASFDALMAVIDDVRGRLRIDDDRIYVTGLSMGGFGTWQLATAYPERFAAIAPICGGGLRYTPYQIAHLPVWAFHGARDTVVPLEESQKMIDGIRQHGGEPRFTVYPEAGHDSWTETYDNPELYEWLLSHKRGQ